MKPIRAFLAEGSPLGSGLRSVLQTLPGIRRSLAPGEDPGSLSQPAIPAPARAAALCARAAVSPQRPVRALDWDLEMRPVDRSARRQVSSLEEENERLRATLAGLATLREELPDDLAARLAALSPSELSPTRPVPALPPPDDEEYLGFRPRTDRAELGGSDWSW